MVGSHRIMGAHCDGHLVDPECPLSFSAWPIAGHTQWPRLSVDRQGHDPRAWIWLTHHGSGGRTTIAPDIITDIAVRAAAPIFMLCV